MCADPSAPGRGDQAKRAAGGRAWPACLALLALAACAPGTGPLEAARVAAGRAPTAGLPPVPGADRPFPSLGTVPERPVPPSPEARRRIADALVADRENARHVGPPVRPAPVGLTPPPAPAPAPLAAAPATPLDPADPAAEVPGMVTPLAPPPPPPPPIAGAPREAGAPAAEPAAPPPAAPPAAPPPAAPPPAAAAAPAPVAAPPARAAAPDPSVIVDRTALPPSRPAAPVALPAGQGAALAFAPGSAALTAEARAVVARFAAGRGAAVVRVTGYRDSAGGDLGLALARAQAVAQALRASGLPAEAIELAAEPRPGPAGRGADMRLVYSP